MTREMVRDADLDQIRRIPLLAGLAPVVVAGLIAEAWVVSYDSRTLMLSSGEAADRFFVVLAGRVRLFILTAQGRESVIEVIEPGQSFAEAAMFGSGRIPVNAEAEPGARVVHIPARLMLSRIAEDPALALKIMDSLARWQRQLVGLIGGLKKRTPGQRLAAALLALTTVETGPVTVQLPETKAGVAARIGITPESLSRALGRLRACGVLNQGRTVTIGDVAALRRYVEEDGPLSPLGSE